MILLTNDKARKLEGVVEVETGESVNSLETLAQWGPFSRLRVPFHLYVPPHTLDTVRRLCRDHNVTVAELWTYHTNLDQVRFTLVQKAPDAALAAARKAGIERHAEAEGGAAAFPAPAPATPATGGAAGPGGRDQGAVADRGAEGRARQVRGRGGQSVGGQERRSRRMNSAKPAPASGACAKFASRKAGRGEIR